MLIPKPILKIIGLFRGNVSPTYILISAGFGFWFGLTPGWYGIHVALLVLALILAIHAGTFIMFAALGKALCYAAAPVWYHVGRWAQTNLGVVYDTLGNLPIVGITDFSRCAVAGATIAGPVIGLVGGLFIAAAVTKFRKTWLHLDENSDAFKKWQQKSWVRWLDWLLLGKRTKDVRSALKQKWQIIRIPGVIVAVVVLAGGAVGLNYIQGDRLGGMIAQQLSSVNGAEVNLASFNLAPFAGAVSAEGLQLTNAEKPAEDKVRVGKLTADAGLWNLLCGRIVIDNVELGSVAFDVPRDTPGEVLASAQTTSAEEEASGFDPSQFSLTPADVSRFIDFVKNAQDVKDKLAEAAEWLPERDSPPPPPPPAPQAYLEYLTARTTSAPTPFVVVRRAVLEDVDLGVRQLGRSTITCRNLSDAPVAAARPVQITIESTERPAKLDLTCRYDRNAGGAEVSGTIGEVDLQELQAELSDKNPVRFESGTADVELSGDLSRDAIDLKLGVQTKGMKARTSGDEFLGLDPKVADEAFKAIENLKTTLRLVGPIRDPRLALDAEGFKESLKTALVDAGKQQLVSQLDKAIGDKLPESVPKVEDVTKDPLGSGKKALEDFLGGKKKDEDK